MTQPKSLCSTFRVSGNCETEQKLTNSKKNIKKKRSQVSNSSLKWPGAAEKFVYYFCGFADIFERCDYDFVN